MKYYTSTLISPKKVKWKLYSLLSDVHENFNSDGETHSNFSFLISLNSIVKKSLSFLWAHLTGASLIYELFINLEILKKRVTMWPFLSELKKFLFYFGIF